MANNNEEALKEAAKLLREAAKPSLSRDEIRAQRVSFAMGMKDSKSTITKRELQQLVKDRY